MNMRIQKLLGWVISLLIPYVLIMTAGRVLLTPTFIRLEYKMPGFPQDKYGFTEEDRLRWAVPSFKYLVNTSDLSYLEDLKFDDSTPVYNQRELSHMQDVKLVVRPAIKIWLASLAVVLLIILILENTKGRDQVRKSLYRGGWIALGFVALILAMVAIDFDTLFTQFHHIFFEGDTWLFMESDTLIRLFPLRLFMDVFIYMGSFTILAAIALLILFRPRKKA